MGLSSVPKSENIKLNLDLRNMKAVLVKNDGTEQIVGYARWKTVLVDEGGVGIYGYLQEDQNVERNATNETKENKVKTVANEKLCDDFFIPGDRLMAAACEGKNYHSKHHIRYLFKNQLAAKK